MFPGALHPGGRAAAHLVLVSVEGQFLPPARGRKRPSTAWSGVACPRRVKAVPSTLALWVKSDVTLTVCKRQFGGIEHTHSAVRLLPPSLPDLPHLPRQPHRCPQQALAPSPLPQPPAPSLLRCVSVNVRPLGPSRSGPRGICPVRLAPVAEHHVLRLVRGAAGVRPSFPFTAGQVSTARTHPRPLDCWFPVRWQLPSPGFGIKGPCWGPVPLEGCWRVNRASPWTGAKSPPETSQ